MRHRTISTWQFKAAVLKNSLGAKSVNMTSFLVAQGSSKQPKFFQIQQIKKIINLKIISFKYWINIMDYCNYTYITSTKGKFPGNQALLHKALRPWRSVRCTCALAASRARAASTRPCAAATLSGAIPDASASSGSAFSRSNLSRSSEICHYTFTSLYIRIIYIYVFAEIMYRAYIVYTIDVYTIRLWRIFRKFIGILQYSDESIYNIIFYNKKVFTNLQSLQVYCDLLRQLCQAPRASDRITRWQRAVWHLFGGPQLQELDEAGPRNIRTQFKCPDAVAHHKGVRPSGPGWFFFAPAWTKHCITCKWPVSAAAPKGDGISACVDLEETWVDERVEQLEKLSCSWTFPTQQEQ